RRADGVGGAPGGPDASGAPASRLIACLWLSDRGASVVCVERVPPPESDPGCPSDTRGPSPRDPEGGAPMRALRILGVSAAVVALLATAACGGESLEDSNSEDNSGSDGSTENKGSLTLSGQNFTEMEIMAEMYKQVLENAGYDVTTKLVTTRDIY